MIHFLHSYFIALTMKKILITIFCFFFIFIWSAFGDETWLWTLPSSVNTAEEAFWSESQGDTPSNWAAKSKSCANWDENNFCSPKFEIKVNTFSPGWNEYIWNWISSFFTTLIEKLLIWLWVIALLIMTVGAGYMIFYHGQDEYLSKGKSIFMAWITALIVALSSYYLVSLLRYILYS